METKIIETPIGKRKIELKCWLTGRDRRAIESVFYEEIDISVSGEKPDVKGIKGGIINRAQDKLIETVVVSIDGSGDNILNTVLDMHDDDFSFLIKEIDEITKKKIG